MKTVVIQIGNTDNKLTQQEWSYFIVQVQAVIEYLQLQIHFAGGSSPEKPHQNYCWVCECSINQMEEIATRLTSIRKFFKQDSLALTIGNTEFI